MRGNPVVLLALLIGVSAASADPVSDEAAIRARLHAWADAFNARDAEGVCELFAEDVRSVVPGTVDGSKAAVCERLRKFLGQSDRRPSYAPDIHEIMISGDQAVVALTWTLSVEHQGKTTVSREEGLDVFQRQPDGAWRIVRFIAFTDKDE